MSLLTARFPGRLRAEASAAAALQNSRRNWRRAMRLVLDQSQAERAVLCESAFPAYSHVNPLARWLFWSRLSRTAAWLDRTVASRGRVDSVLDFGCGGGVMLPALAAVSRKVVACDVELSPLRAVARHVELPAHVHMTNDLGELPANSQDLILALDVLEHVDDLPATLQQLFNLLRDGGALVVSGPTENWLYRLGRRLAGRDFTGHYHCRDIFDIAAAMRDRFALRTLATLYYPIPLFKLYVGVKRNVAATEALDRSADLDAVTGGR